MRRQNDGELVEGEKNPSFARGNQTQCLSSKEPVTDRSAKGLLSDTRILEFK